MFLWRDADGVFDSEALEGSGAKRLVAGEHYWGWTPRRCWRKAVGFIVRRLCAWAFRRVKASDQ